MSNLEEKFDYQEITVEELFQVYKIANDCNSFHKLPRQSRENLGAKCIVYD